MKRILIIIIVTLISVGRTHAQEQEIQQLLLNVEKLAQLKQILSDMKKGYQVVSTGYNSIKDLSEGNFSLHKTFLDGLMQVSPVVRNYPRVKQIIDYQLVLVKEYRSAAKRFKQNKLFSPDEVGYIEKVYGNLFKKSLDNLDELSMIITANKLRMSDDERLKAIDRIYLDMQDKVMFLKDFNNNTSVLAAQRAKEQREVDAMKKSYGITK